MSTRALIFVKLQDNNKIKSSLNFGTTLIPQDNNNLYAYIYCHHDGYPNGVGKVLRENYNSYDKAINLISNGHTSYIEDNISDCGYYAYKEGFEDNKPVITNSPFEIKKLRADCEYFYLFNEEWQEI